MGGAKWIPRDRGLVVACLVTLAALLGHTRCGREGEIEIEESGAEDVVERGDVGARSEGEPQTRGGSSEQDAIELVEHLLLLLEVLGRDVETDLDLVDMLRLAAIAATIDPDRLHGLVPRPPLVRGQITDDGKQVLVANDRRALTRAVQGVFEAPAPGTRVALAKCPSPDAAARARARRDDIRGGRDLRGRLARGARPISAPQGEGRSGGRDRDRADARPGAGSGADPGGGPSR